jgi:hypothetical protein
MSVRVKTRKPHVEHNESAPTLIADIPGDMDFRCNGPRTDIDGTADRSPRIESALFQLGDWLAPRPVAEPFEATRRLHSRHGAPVGAHGR